MLTTHRSRTARGLIRTALAAALLLCSWAMSGLTAAATANSAQAAALVPGIYQIINVASHSTLRAYNAGEAAFVSSTREYPGPFAHWKITRSGDGYTIQNVGINGYAAVRWTEEGASVITNNDAMVWTIAPAGGYTWVIQAPYRDLLWNVEPPVIPRGDVKLRPADGSVTQLWRFEYVSE
ncbi:RICIN domain-containing protein [Nonomuraea spiralis]|uniref:RICIN domain-containing protein n=1 Tax=Nonomuraea spiralis TaxID=46182 RepID=A0ABV5IRP1_9ACTN|nr:RICIN domain-containing protein [Nonomuraea spiralis]